MSRKPEVPLEQRQTDYEAAEVLAVEVAERWFDARAGRRMTKTLEQELDDAHQGLVRAKRRLEKTERRLP